MKNLCSAWRALYPDANYAALAARITATTRCWCDRSRAWHWINGTQSVPDPIQAMMRQEILAARYPAKEAAELVQILTPPALIRPRAHDQAGAAPKNAENPVESIVAEWTGAVIDPPDTGAAGRRP